MGHYLLDTQYVKYYHGEKANNNWSFSRFGELFIFFLFFYLLGL